MRFQELGSLPMLEKIDADYNPLKVPPPEVAVAGGVFVLNYLQNFGKALHSNVLDLEGMRLESIPEGVFALTNLTGLQLRHNALSALPDELWAMKQLRHLDIGRNQIQAISEDISKLTKLHVLLTDFNEVSVFPSKVQSALLFLSTCLPQLFVLAR